MLLRELLGLGFRRDVVELVNPRRTFEDVILPPATRQSLDEALTQIEKHRLIFLDWGLAERHATGTGLAFHFAGPPGTGKTICAEAVARALGKKLLRVRYSEVESCWVGESAKNVVAAFREARQQDAVLFFDEADSIASRRFSGTSSGYEREANQTVNVLLSELENTPGVVIFATNLASNLDPAFERRIRTHILFELPDPAARERIWRVQVHPQKTPLAADVDFRKLSELYELSGGDIQNAVLRAAQIAAGEGGRDRDKTIRQEHFVAAIGRVLYAKGVMQQNLFGEVPPPAWALAAAAIEERTRSAEDEIRSLRSELSALRTEVAERVRRESALWEERLRSATLLPVPRWVTIAVALLALAASGVFGWASAALHWIPPHP